MVSKSMIFIYIFIFCIVKNILYLSHKYSIYNNILKMNNIFRNKIIIDNTLKSIVSTKNMIKNVSEIKHKRNFNR